ncbi:hypothetical protein JW905_04105 [bacterium]|nr:hypothetical protein [candidate division CSSED10-310 bacterium]
MRRELLKAMGWFSAAVILGLIAHAAPASAIVLEDPLGDDDGSGAYIYPTDPVYARSAFDILKLQVKERGEKIEFALTIKANIENPWNMDSGFSVQMAQIYLDTDHADASGWTDALPGINARFSSREAWDKVIIISPQPRSRLQAEIKSKAADRADAVIIPLKVTPRGKTFIALVGKDELGGVPTEQWGYQVVMTSNEGFPSSKEILTRHVNAEAEQHRFGGGDDGLGDPHFIDMLFPPAEGEKTEATGQHLCLAEHVSSEDEPEKNQWAVIPMVYPAAQ